jgi:hypothetical protein
LTETCEEIAHVYFSELTQKWTFDCETHDESIGFTFKWFADRALESHLFLEEALRKTGKAVM